MTTKPKRKYDWVGLHVRLLHQVQTKGGTVFLPGSIMLVKRNFGGLHLEALHVCGTCARARYHHVNKVPEREVEIIPTGSVSEHVDRRYLSKMEQDLLVAIANLQVELAAAKRKTSDGK